MIFVHSETLALRRLQNASIKGDKYRDLAKLPQKDFKIPDNYPLNVDAFINLCEPPFSCARRCPVVHLTPWAAAGSQVAEVHRLLQAYELSIPATSHESIMDLAAFLGINSKFVRGTAWADP